MSKSITKRNIHEKILFHFQVELNEVLKGCEKWYLHADVKIDLKQEQKDLVTIIKKIWEAPSQFEI